jgi:hypothetical protein
MAKSDFIFNNLEGLRDKLLELIKKEAGKRKPKPSPDPSRYGFPEEATSSAPGVEPSASKGTRMMIKIIQFCLLMVIGSFAIQNIKPYIAIAEWLGDGISLPVIEALSKMPVISIVMGLGKGTLAFICGVLIWGLLQGMQMLPTIILDDPEALLVLMSWVYAFKQIAYRDSDSPLLRQLKDQFNSIPVQWIESMQVAKAIAYLIDGFLCFGFYPPLIGGYDRLGVFLTAPSLNDIDFRNLLAALITMFAVEVLYKIWKMLNSALMVIAQSKANAA